MRETMARVRCGGDEQGVIGIRCRQRRQMARAEEAGGGHVLEVEEDLGGGPLARKKKGIGERW